MVLIVFASTVLVWLLAMFYRNELVYDVRASYHSSPLYDTLPSYDSMVFSPRYYLLWTENSWKRKVEGK